MIIGSIIYKLRAVVQRVHITLERLHIYAFGFSRKQYPLQFQDVSMLMKILGTNSFPVAGTYFNILYVLEAMELRHVGMKNHALYVRSVG